MLDGRQKDGIDGHGVAGRGQAQAGAALAHPGLEHGGPFVLDAIQQGRGLDQGPGHQPQGQGAGAQGTEPGRQALAGEGAQGLGPGRGRGVQRADQLGMGAGGDAGDDAVGTVEIAIDQLPVAAGFCGQGLDIEAGKAVAQQDTLTGLDDEGLGGGAAAQTDGRIGHERSIGPAGVSRQAVARWPLQC